MTKRGLVNGIATVAVVAATLGAAVAIAGVLPGEPAPMASITAQQAPAQPAADASQATADGSAAALARPPQSTLPTEVTAASVQPTSGSGFNAVIPASLGGDDDDDDDEDGDEHGDDDHDDDHDGDHHDDRHDDDD